MPYEIENRKHAFTVSLTKRLLPAPHIHPHLEMVYLIKGSSVAVADNKEYLIKQGELFLAFPNQIHFYHDKEEVEGYLIIFSPELYEELRDVFQSKVPTCSILQESQLPKDTAKCLEIIYKSKAAKTSFDEVVAKGCLLAFLGEILSRMKLVDVPGESDAIKRILSYCVENYTQPLSLEVLSKELYLNKYYISHIFRERMHMSFKDFINNLRIEHACGLLQKGTSVTETVYASGFSTVRTFNNAFLKHMKMTPREYVKKKKIIQTP